jgi:hypothetical protein
MAYDSTEDTKSHIAIVQMLIGEFCSGLLVRGMGHDKDKLSGPFKEALDIWTPRLKNTQFGSKEYEAARAAMGFFIQEHYAKNRHHPEHFDNGMAGMTLVDLVEMFMDWVASTKRHKNGHILHSIEALGERFGYPPMLKQIFINTAESMLPFLGNPEERNE